MSELSDGDLALVEKRAEEGTYLRNEALQLPSLRSLLRADALAGGSLLHGVYAAESADVALAKRNGLKAGESIVTREGFWVGPD